MRGGKDITGTRAGKLVAVRRAHKHPKNGRWVWLCKCDCGGEAFRLGHLITKAAKKGQPSSCGCEHQSRTHGLSTENRKLFQVWCSMRQRCTNENSKDYPRYGGRGISVCDEWQDFAAFHEWAMSSGYTEGVTIERVDVNAGYNPGNCCWIENSRQALNLEKSIRITYQGRTQHISDWAKETGICYRTLKMRLITLGWPVDAAMTVEPVLGRNQHDRAF